MRNLIKRNFSDLDNYFNKSNKSIKQNVLKIELKIVKSPIAYKKIKKIKKTILHRVIKPIIKKYRRIVIPDRKLALRIAIKRSNVLNLKKKLELKDVLSVSIAQLLKNIDGLFPQVLVRR